MAQLLFAKTCHLTFKEGKLPAQAVFNKLDIFEPLEVTEKLNRQELVLISRRILFKKVNMPNGNFPKINVAFATFQ